MEYINLNDPYEAIAYCCLGEIRPGLYKKDLEDVLRSTFVVTFRDETEDVDGFIRRRLKEERGHEL